MVEIKKMIVHKLNIGGESAILSNSLINIDNLEDKAVALSFFLSIFLIQEYKPLLSLVTSEKTKATT